MQCSAANCSFLILVFNEFFFSFPVANDVMRVYESKNFGGDYVAIKRESCTQISYSTIYILIRS